MRTQNEILRNCCQILVLLPESFFFFFFAFCFKFLILKVKYCSLKYFSVKNISSCTSHNLIQNPENGKKINKNCHFRHFLYFIEVLGTENEILLSQFFLCRKYTWSSTSPENLNVFLCFQNCFEVPKNEKNDWKWSVLVIFCIFQ